MAVIRGKKQLRVEVDTRFIGWCLCSNSALVFEHEHENSTNQTDTQRSGTRTQRSGTRTQRSGTRTRTQRWFSSTSTSTSKSASTKTRPIELILSEAVLVLSEAVLVLELSAGFRAEHEQEYENSTIRTDTQRSGA